MLVGQLDKLTQLANLNTQEHSGGRTEVAIVYPSLLHLVVQGHRAVARHSSWQCGATDTAKGYRISFEVLSRVVRHRVHDCQASPRASSAKVSAETWFSTLVLCAREEAQSCEAVWKSDNESVL